MRTQPALWHDLEVSGMPGWAPPQLRCKALTIGHRHIASPGTMDSPVSDPGDTQGPACKRVRAAFCYIMAREE
eukprot:9934789-Prorocentrum_lima.AAC.1